MEKAKRMLKALKDWEDQLLAPVYDFDKKLLELEDKKAEIEAYFKVRQLVFDITKEGTEQIQKSAQKELKGIGVQIKEVNESKRKYESDNKKYFDALNEVKKTVENDFRKLYNEGR